MSSQKRILVAASMNAGAEVLAPLVKRLGATENAITRVLSYRAATRSFKAMGIEPYKELETASMNKCKRAFNAFKPTTLVTGTQVQDKDHPVTLEQMLWFVARKRNIKSIAVLDTWDNYIERFSDLVPSTDGNKLTIKKRTELKHLPTQIAIMDEFAKKEMLRLGFSEDVLAVTGSPYFEHVLTEAEKLTPETRKQLLEKPVFSLFDKDGKLIVFMSDNIEGFYPDIGYTEKSVLQSFLKSMDVLAERTGIKLNILVRPHPFRNENAKEAYECETGHLSKTFHNPVTSRGNDRANEYSMEELLHSADLIVGTFNNPLITAKIMGKPVLSYQPDLNDKYNFQYYLHEQGMVTKVTDENKLGQAVIDLLNGKIIQKSMEAMKGAGDRIIKLLQ
jgi:hypothetical protein